MLQAAFKDYECNILLNVYKMSKHETDYAQEYFEINGARFTT